MVPAHRPLGSSWGTLCSGMSVKGEYSVAFYLSFSYHILATIMLCLVTAQRLTEKYKINQVNFLDI